MSMTIEITDTVTPALTALARQVEKPRDMLAASGRRLSHELREHFIRRDSEGNQHGDWRSHFWAKKVKAVTHFVSASDTEAIVVIASREFLHKLKGGTITAKEGKMLAIPLNSAAKQAGSPRESGLKLFLVKTPSQLFLARLTGSGKKAAHGIEFLYILKRSVTQAADPRALPPMIYLESVVLDEAKQYLERERRAA